MAQYASLEYGCQWDFACGDKLVALNFDYPEGIIRVLQIPDGWPAAPVRVEVDDFPMRDGSIVYPSFVSGRTVTLTIEIVADNNSDADTLFWRLMDVINAAEDSDSDDVGTATLTQWPSNDSLSGQGIHLANITTYESPIPSNQTSGGWAPKGMVFSLTSTDSTLSLVAADTRYTGE